jgi:hypothetical protein
LDVVKHLRTHHNHHPKWDLGRAFEAAVFNGHLELVQFFLETEGADYEIRDILRSAASGGSLNVLKLLYTRFGQTSTPIAWGDVYFTASSSGHLNIMNYLLSVIDLGIDEIQRGLEGATFHGHINIIRHYFERYRSLFSPDIFGYAVSDLDYEDPLLNLLDDPWLNVVQFLEANVSGYREKAMRITACCNPDAIRIIHGSSCHPDRCHPAGMDYAAAHSKGLDAVKFLAEHCKAGCTYRAMQWAKENENSDIVEYLSGVQNLVREVDDEEYSRGVCELSSGLYSFLDMNCRRSTRKRK